MLEWLISIEVISSANRSRKHDSISQNGKKKQRLDNLTHFRVSHRIPIFAGTALKFNHPIEKGEWETVPESEEMAVAAMAAMDQLS